MSYVDGGVFVENRMSLFYNGFYNLIMGLSVLVGTFDPNVILLGTYLLRDHIFTDFITQLRHR